MAHQVEAAFAEMLDISTDIDKAILIGPDGVLASNMTEEAQGETIVQAQELTRLIEARTTEMGSQPVTQLVVETPSGYVFFARETGEGAMSMLATGKKSSRVGLVLYDLRTCLRDAREAMSVETAVDEVTPEE
ncbi:MAG: hypothetical protein JW990_21160 [Thermoleophilia bacterium]|nr:hypothetical protein [Thermoleophilia bacterium]